MQSMARKNEWPLDKMALQCDVTKKNKEDFNNPPREGSYISGMFMEGLSFVVCFMIAKILSNLNQLMQCKNTFTVTIPQHLL